MNNLVNSLLATLCTLSCVSTAACAGERPEVTGYRKFKAITQEVLRNVRRNEKRPAGQLPTLSNLPIGLRSRLRATKSLFSGEPSAKFLGRYACCMVTRHEFVAMMSRPHDKMMQAVAKAVGQDYGGFYDATTRRRRFMEPIALREEKAIEKMLLESALRIARIWTQ